jgi:hypothetical protein
MLFPSQQSLGDYYGGVEIWAGALGSEKHHFLECRRHHQKRSNCLCLNFPSSTIRSSVLRKPRNQALHSTLPRDLPLAYIPAWAFKRVVAVFPRIPLCLTPKKLDIIQFRMVLWQVEHPMPAVIDRWIPRSVADFLFQSALLLPKVGLHGEKSQHALNSEIRYEADRDRALAVERARALSGFRIINDHSDSLKMARQHRLSLGRSRKWFSSGASSCT